MNTAGKDVSSPRINAMTLGVSFFWSVLIVAIAGSSYWQSRSATFEMARSAVHEGYIKDVV